MFIPLILSATMLDADYRIEKSENADQVVMTAVEIAQWNEEHPNTVTAGEDPKDHFYDTLVTSEYMPFLPLRVLHESSDGNWYFVMFSGYAGWVEKKYVALCDSREEWLERQEPEK